MDLERVSYISLVDIDATGVKPGLELQKATGWAQEYIEHIDYVHFKNFYDLNHGDSSRGMPSFSYSYQDVAKWLLTLDSSERYLLNFFSRLPCNWRGDPHEAY